MEEISFRGHPIAYIAPSNYGQSQVSSFFCQLLIFLNQVFDQNEKTIIRTTLFENVWFVYEKVTYPVLSFFACEPAFFDFFSSDTFFCVFDRHCWYIT